MDALDDVVRVVVTVDGDVVMQADSRSGLCANVGESDGDGVPDVIFTKLCSTSF